MRFSSTMEQLGVSLIGSVMTLIAFLPVLFRIGAGITELPLIGQCRTLVWASLFWSLFGTLFLALGGHPAAGTRGFRNQRVEAAIAKEPVYGEDHADRAQPGDGGRTVRQRAGRTTSASTSPMYFNVARIFYLQSDSLFSLFVFIPSIIAGRLTLGRLLTQVTNVSTRSAARSSTS